MSEALTKVDLKKVDVYFLIDASSSMGGKSGVPGGKLSRWEFSAERIQGIVRDLGAYDDDGISMAVFSDEFKIADNVTVDSFDTTWSQYHPGGGTYIAPPLAWATKLAKERWENKHQFIGILTDGEPSDQDEIARVIVEVTRKMNDKSQLAILFLQVGNDPKATAYLDRLNNHLSQEGAEYDIVAVKRIEDAAKMTTEELVEYAFNN